MLPVLLASGSEIRAQMLRNARVPFTVSKARIDEESFLRSMEAEGVSPRDMADHLAEMKAAKVARRNPEAIVIGCDQVLECDATYFTKPENPVAARQQLAALSGRTHLLHSAAVLFDQGRPAWRHVESVKLAMRPLSTDFIDDYVARNWADIRHCVGCYQIEAEGVRLFSRIDGDYFAILGLPLLPLLDHLAKRGVIET